MIAHRFGDFGCCSFANDGSRSAISTAAANNSPPIVSVLVPRLMAKMRSRWCRSFPALTKKRFWVPLVVAFIIHQFSGGQFINGIHLTYPFYSIYNRAVNSNRCDGV
jgi:hypothetical protein